MEFTIPPIVAEFAGIVGLALGTIVSVYALSITSRQQELIDLGKTALDAAKDGKVSSAEIGGVIEKAIDALKPEVR